MLSPPHRLFTKSGSVSNAVKNKKCYNLPFKAVHKVYMKNIEFNIVRISYFCTSC